MVTPDSKSFRIPSSKDSDTSSVDDSSTVDKTRNAPPSQTSFKDVMDKKKDNSKGDQEQLAQGNMPFNIFDLQSNTDTDISSKSSSAISALASASTASRGEGLERFDMPTNAGPVASSTKFSSNSEFSQEQPDISGVNAQGYISSNAQAPINTIPMDTPAINATHQANLQQLVDQLVDKMSVLSSTGKTDTVMTLRFPPVMAGVDIVISSFDSAKGEFNIAFHNVTQMADKLLSMQAAQAQLRHGLEEKGYLVHIVVVTAKPIEANLAADASDATKQQGQQQQGQSFQQQQQQKQG